jgi:hypothetical protein
MAHQRFQLCITHWNKDLHQVFFGISSLWISGFSDLPQSMQKSDQ